MGSLLLKLLETICESLPDWLMLNKKSREAKCHRFKHLLEIINTYHGAPAKLCAWSFSVNKILTFFIFLHFSCRLRRQQHNFFGRSVRLRRHPTTYRVCDSHCCEFEPKRWGVPSKENSLWWFLDPRKIEFSPTLLKDTHLRKWAHGSHSARLDTTWTKFQGRRPKFVIPNVCWDVWPEHLFYYNLARKSRQRHIQTFGRRRLLVRRLYWVQTRSRRRIGEYGKSWWDRWVFGKFCRGWVLGETFPTGDSSRQEGGHGSLQCHGSDEWSVSDDLERVWGVGVGQGGDSRWEKVEIYKKD